MGELVAFNVGGKVYTVLREPTLSLHPTSLLTQLAEEKKEEKEIFVEGDQDLFKYVLEYHRDRKVILPPLVSKEAVLRELKRFGLDVAPDRIAAERLDLPSVSGVLELESQRLQKRKRESCTELLVSLTAKLILAKGMKPGVRRVAVTYADVREDFATELPEGSPPRALDALSAEADGEQFERAMKAWLASVGYSGVVTRYGGSDWQVAAVAGYKPTRARRRR